MEGRGRELDERGAGGMRVFVRNAVSCACGEDGEFDLVSARERLRNLGETASIATSRAGSEALR